MIDSTLLDSWPLWLLYLVVIGLFLVSVVIGRQLGLRHRGTEDKESSIGSLVGTMLGLLAFLLAFTFGMSASRFDARKSLVLQEANAVGTTYLRAAMLPSPHDTVSRDLLREYVDVRVKGVLSGQVESALVRSEELQEQLWAEAVLVKQEGTDTPLTGLYVASLNEVIDLNAMRIAAARNRIPSIIWLTLFLVAILAFGSMGYQVGLSGNRIPIILIIVVVVFATVMALIADLDRSQQGLINVSQQAMIDLQNSMARDAN
jgi:hypothetical protein